MRDDLPRWVVIDRALTATEAEHVVADILATSHENGEVRSPAFVVAPADRAAAIAAGLDPAALAPWGTVLRLVAVGGVDQASYMAGVNRLQQGLHDASFKVDLAWGSRIGSSDSIYDKLRSVRRPRVHVRIPLPDTIEAPVADYELPFVIGIIGELAGNRGPAAVAPDEPAFQLIDRDNFDQVLASIAPRLVFDVPNLIAADGSALTIDLTFAALADFAPARVAQRLEALVPRGASAEGVARQLAAVVEAAPFRRLESSWRNLNDLVMGAQTGYALRVMVCPIAKEALRADLVRSTDRRDSWLFRRVCTDAFRNIHDRARAEPLAVLIGDVALAANEDDAALLSGIAEAAFAGLASLVCAEAADTAEREAWRRRAASPALRNVTWARLPATTGHHAAADPAYALCERLADLFAQFAWYAALDWPDDASRCEPPGLGARLCAAGFARHLARLFADHADGRSTPAELEAWANRWLASYVMSQEEATDVVRAARPLRAARVELVADPEGRIAQAVVSLHLGYQVDAQQPPMRMTIPIAMG